MAVVVIPRAVLAAAYLISAAGLRAELEPVVLAVEDTLVTLNDALDGSSR